MKSDSLSKDQQDCTCRGVDRADGLHEPGCVSQKQPINKRLRFSAQVNRSGGYDGDAEEREEAAETIERMCRLLLEARDALPAITLTAAKLRGISLSLADRIEQVLAPWRDPEGV